MFALFKNGKIISKPYPTMDECADEAIKLRLVKPMPIICTYMLSKGVSIKDLNTK